MTNFSLTLEKGFKTYYSILTIKDMNSIVSQCLLNGRNERVGIIFLKMLAISFDMTPHEYINNVMGRKVTKRLSKVMGETEGWQSET